MKYFIDTEFLEGPQKEKFPISLFRKQTPNTIDLISIGIAAEDGREYYAISKDFNLEEAWNRYDLKPITGSGDANNLPPTKEYWIRENVLKPIWEELNINHSYPFKYKFLKRLINKYGKTNQQISREIVGFIYPNALYNNLECKISDMVLTNCADSEKPEFYAYYADYDWVVFCWLFGKMIDLPNGFPMYCIDLKQMLDEIGKLKYGNRFNYDEMVNHIKNNPTYPKQTNDHHALSDARWNKKSHEFLSSL